MRADFVFVHGFTQTERSWGPVCEAWPDPGEPDVRLDLFLRIPPELGFAATASALGSATATYVGYSMGGRLCLQLALDHPELVERLGLVSASPGIRDAGERAVRRAADERLAQDIERDGVDAFLERWLSQPLFATLPPERAGAAERSAHNTVERLTHQLRVLGQGAQPSNWDRLAELQMPVLLIVGELDTKYVDIAHRMAGDIPHARVEVVAGAGHACHLEQPEVVAQLLASW